MVVVVVVVVRGRRRSSNHMNNNSHRGSIKGTSNGSVVITRKEGLATLATRSGF